MVAEEKKGEVFTINECAEFLKLSPRLVYDLLSEERVQGKIFAKEVGQSWRILRVEVDRFLQEETDRPSQLTLRPEPK